MTRITGPWNKLPPDVYNSTYYALIRPIEVGGNKWMREHGHNQHYMSSAKSKFSTLQEALKSGVQVAKKNGGLHWYKETFDMDKIYYVHQAFIYKGDKQIGVIQYMFENRYSPYVATYTPSNGKIMYLNSDGSEYKANSVSAKSYSADIYFEKYRGRTVKLSPIAFKDYRGLIKYVIKEYEERLSSDYRNYIHVYVGGKRIASLNKKSWNKYVWWEIGKDPVEYEYHSFYHKTVKKV